MMLKDLQERIRKFNTERDWDSYHSPKNLSMSILIEAAELAEIFQWLSEEQSWKPEERDLEHAGEEIADVLIYLLNLSDRLGIDPYEAALRKLEMNACKYPVEKCRGSRLKYDRLEEEGL